MYGGNMLQLLGVVAVATPNTLSTRFASSVHAAPSPCEFVLTKGCILLAAAAAAAVSRLARRAQARTAGRLHSQLCD
jgi:hypothetical protein